MRTETVSVAGASIAVTVGGEGPAVLMIPSLGRSGDDFDKLACALQHAGLRTLCVDPRGTGRSSAIDGALTLTALARDALAVIDQLGDGRAHVLGHAFGNRVARQLAAERPDGVRSLVLLAAGGLVEPEADALAAFREFLGGRLTGSDRLAAIARANFAPGNDPSAWRDGWWPEAARAQIQAARSAPAGSWWTPPAGIAVLVVQGLEDRMAPPANGRALRDALGAQLRLVELAHAGHALLPEQPDAIAQAVISFLTDTQRGFIDVSSCRRL